MHDSLAIVLVLLAVAVVAVVGFRQLGLPPMLGYLVAGVLIGPHALGWVPEPEQARQLAEFGIVFLMFSIGLEFSLPKLYAMRRIVLGLGGAQVLATIAIAMIAAPLLLPVDWRGALVLGGAIAMSSTAIVMKMLAERLALGSDHGRQIVGVLLFQDLAVVPLLIVIPALGRPAGELLPALVLAGAKVVFVLALLLVFGQRLMRPWFHLVARQKSSELFMLNVLLITLGLAWVTELAGLSAALGAFVAGMLISETEYRFQVEDDIRPFRDVLLGLFFVTIGMTLDTRAVIDDIGWVAVFLVGGVLLKIGLIAGLARLFGNSTSGSVRVGLDLAQAGEFGFVLLALPAAGAVVPPEVMQPVLAAMLLSMLAAPFIIEKSERLARHMSGADWLARSMELTQIAAQTMSADAHVLICGFGRCGQGLAHMLAVERIPYFALDLDPSRIQEAAAAGEPVVYGDATRQDVLTAAGIQRARAMVVTFNEVETALRILAHVHEMRPDLPVIVRTTDDADLDRLQSAGAAEVVAEIMEGSLMLASSTLMHLGVPLNRVLRRIRSVREARYGVLRSFFHGAPDRDKDAHDHLHPRLHAVTIPPGAACVGKRVADLALGDLGAAVNAVRKRNVRSLQSSPDTVLEEGDVVVLLGIEADIAAAEIRLMQG